MADKVVGIKIDVQDSGRLSQLEQNLVKLGQRRRELNKLVREGTTLTDREAKELGELGTQAQATRNKINDLKNGILKQNDALKKNSGFVAGVRKGMGQWAISMIGITSAIAGVTKLVGSAAKIFKDFEKANSKLQSVLGATSDEMKKLKFQAKELGSVTSFTASQVTELQTEFAKLGFPTKEILNMTESTLAAAAAMGSGLGEQAALTGATIKAFGLSSEDAARVNDVLAKSTSRSALDFSKLNTSMSTIAPVASKLGFGLEDTVALLGNLSDSGFDASTAATATRNIMLKLADSSSVLGKRLNEPVKDLPSLIKGLKQLTNEGVDLSEALELTDVRSVAAFSTFLSGTDSLEKLSDELNNANGAAKEMADTMLDNLAGDTEKAKSAWEGFVLSVESGDGIISKALRSLVQDFTGLFSGLTKFNRTLKEVELEKLSHQFKVFADTGKQAAKDVVSDFKKAGIEGDNLTAAIERATVKAKENYKQAKARKDLNMSISYFEEWKALKKLLNPTEKNTEETDAELSDKEKEAINEKARKRAEAQREAQRKALSDIEQQEAQDLEGEEGMSLDDFDAIIEKNENLLALDQEFLDAKKAQREQAIFDEIEAEEEAANKVREFERLKRDARRATFDITADFFNLGASLAKEGSIEQKALASAAALVQTYQAAQAAYLSQLSIPTPSAPFRAAAAAAVATATGLANVAKINAVKAQRGMLIQGNSHAMGGVPFSVDGQLGFEAEGGEAIINKKSTQMFRPLLSAINEAGGGVSFAKGGKIKKFQNGGIPNNLSVSSAQQGFLQRQLNLEEFSSTIIEGINNKQVINVASNTSDVATEVFNTQSEATF